MADGIRLNKYLSEAGVCSRRAADTHIENGKVTINGETAVMGQKVMPGDFYGTGSAFCIPSGIGSVACRLRKLSARRSPETAARRRKCPWPVCGVPAWRTWL